QEFKSGFLLDENNDLLQTTQALLPLVGNTETTQSTEGFSVKGIKLATRNELNIVFRLGVLNKSVCAD
ncbi:hypothetical protein CWB56_18830, partial [Pseudoalteromonas sp. S185]|uniref:hypothetical protein n=1 Tax=Pseudoalteromonas sp. S185 TaxID=2066522 RepID=UPI00110898A3